MKTPEIKPIEQEHQEYAYAACRYCSDKLLYWVRFDGHWRLAKYGVLHSCKNKNKQVLIDACSLVENALKEFDDNCKIDFSPLGIEITTRDKTAISDNLYESLHIITKKY